MKEETFKRLSWLHRYQYDSLSKEHQSIIKEFRTNHTKLNRLSKRKTKILKELKEINTELLPLKKKQNEHYHIVKYINKNFKPTTTITIYSKTNKNTNQLYKGENKYVQCLVRIKGMSKTIYCGSLSKVKESLTKVLKTDCSNYTENRVKIELKSFIDKVIVDFVKVDVIDDFTKRKISFKDLIDKY